MCHEQLKSEFYSLFDNYTTNLSVLSCTVDMVDECIENLKSGKAARHDDRTVQCESKKMPPPHGFLKFFPKRLGIFNQFFYTPIIPSFLH